MIVALKIDFATVFEASTMWQDRVTATYLREHSQDFRFKEFGVYTGCKD